MNTTLLGSILTSYIQSCLMNHLTERFQCSLKEPDISGDIFWPAHTPLQSQNTLKMGSFKNNRK